MYIGGLNCSSMCGSCHIVDCSNPADVNCGDTSDDEDKDDDNDVNGDINNSDEEPI